MNKYISALFLITLWALPCVSFAEELVLVIPEPEAPVVEIVPEEVTETPGIPEPEIPEVTEPVLEDPEPVSITLSIETPSKTLFSGPITVSACLPSPEAAVPTINGYCAVTQANVEAMWSWYGGDAFIDSIGGVGNDYAGSNYWNWFSDLSYGTTALNAHELQENESLVVTMGQFPLRIDSSSKVFTVGSTTTLSVSQFGFDPNFNPMWEPARGSTVRVGDTSFTTDEAGLISFTPSSAETITVTATKDGYLPATLVSKTKPAVMEEKPSSGTNEDSESDPVASAVAFLLQYQSPDGSFPNELLTDWGALALQSAGASTKTLRHYLSSAPGNLRSVTDYERRAMALSALGISPEEVVAHILARFDGVQIGVPALINDDIFGLIVLSHAGYTRTDDVIENVIAEILTKQKVDGSFGDTDLTAAAIQALVPFDALPGVSGALQRARGFLVAHQQTDGCFGNSFTTSWGIMAIEALGESPDSWQSSSLISPVTCLTSLQAPDGGFEEGSSINTRIWATAYALPALNGDTWHTLLNDYDRLEVVENIKVKTFPEVPVIAEPVPLVPETPVPAPATEQLESEVLHKAPFIAETAQKTPEHQLTASAIEALPPPDTEKMTQIWSFLVGLLTSSLNALYAFIFGLDAG